MAHSFSEGAEFKAKHKLRVKVSRDRNTNLDWIWDLL